MASSNPLILTDLQQEEEADNLLSALTTIAYETPTNMSMLAVAPKKKRYKSRFFFRLSPSFEEELEHKKALHKPKALDHIDSEVDKRLLTYSKEASKSVKANIDIVREFFLKEIGPRSLAGSAGASQAKEVVQRLLNTPVDDTQFAKFERMSHAAVNIKMARFIAQYYKLPKTEAFAILASIMPKQPPMLIPIGNFPNENTQQPRSTKKSKEKDPV